MTLRSYRPEDHPKLESLIELLNDSDPLLEAETFMVIGDGFPGHDPAADRFVLERADQIIGYGWIGGDRPDRNDCWIGVSPAYRRQGLGKMLFENMLECASKRTASGLMAYLPGREPALEFARAHGFEVKGYFRELHLPAETP